MQKDIEDFKVIVSSHRCVSETNSNPGGSICRSQAVLVRKATKSYGAGRNRSTVLDGLDMTVKKGSM